jgi:hypothetical protein
MNNPILKSVFFVFALLLLAATNLTAQTQGGAQFPGGETYKNAKLTDSIIPAANNTWCYDIYVEDRLFIHQPSVPGLPGNEGFKTKENAEKVAKRVIEKIKNGEVPPSISIEELKKLNVL